MRRNTPRQGREPSLDELAALADGSLAPGRRAEVETWVEASPELAALLEEQRRAVNALRGARVAAPPSLRVRVAQAHGVDGRLRDRRRLLPGRAVGAATLAATCAAALVLVLVLPGGAPDSPTVIEAAELAALGPEEPAPAPDRARPKLLGVVADGLPYPNWGPRFGWRATGTRRDRLGDGRTRTVFYEKRGRRIAYTILSGERLDVPAGGRRVRREGTVLSVLERGGRMVVTWLRRGRTCVLSGAEMELDLLLGLAASP